WHAHALPAGDGRQRSRGGPLSAFRLHRGLRLSLSRASPRARMSARRPSSSDAAPSNVVRDPAGGADHRELARALIDALRARGLHVATAESCTGGGIAAAIT